MSNLNIKLKTRWIILVLLCAVIFGTIGYAYGSYFTSVQCNDYYGSQMMGCNSNFLDGETISSDKSTITSHVLDPNNKVNNEIINEIINEVLK